MPTSGRSGRSAAERAGMDNAGMSVEVFAFEFDPLHRRMSRLFGVSVGSAVVSLTATEFDACFGPWRLSTPYTNIRDVAVTGPYQLIKTIGPPRLSISDRGLTFATNSRAGVCLNFRSPVRGVEPTGHLRHPNLTVTVADPQGLAEALRARLAALEA
jgi:hypothetical protein